MNEFSERYDEEVFKNASKQGRAIILHYFFAGKRRVYEVQPQKIRFTIPCRLKGASRLRAWAVAGCSICALGSFPG